MTFTNKNIRPVVIAGPCSAESRDQVLEIARALKKNPAVKFFRAGLWKPRTRPNSFEGVGEEGLEWLVEVQKEVGLPVMTEVADANHVGLALKYGLDAVWVGARTTVSPFSVQNIADALKGTSLPVMVKNPMHSDLGLWMGAIERISNSTTGEVAALHRGFSNLTQHKYRNAPMWEIPIGLKSEMPDIAIFCDPSHIGGDRQLIASIAQKSMDLGMNGLMIETHTNPDKALSDPLQQVTPSMLLDILSRLEIRDLLTTPYKSLALESLRMKMDSVDEQLIELLKGRSELSEAIGLYKKEKGLTVLQIERYREIVSTRLSLSDDLGIDREFIKSVLEQVHKESIRVQTDIMNSDTSAPSE